MLLCSETAEPIPASTRRRGGWGWGDFVGLRCCKNTPKVCSLCSFASITVSRHDGSHPFSSVRIIPIFLFSLFDGINLAFLSASPWGRLSTFWSSPTASVSVLNWFARNARCRSASFSSFRSDEEQLIVWDFSLCADANGDGVKEPQLQEAQLKWQHTGCLHNKENKSAVKFKKKKI